MRKNVLIVARKADTAVLIQEMLHESVDPSCNIVICDNLTNVQAALESGLMFHLVITDITLVTVNDGIDAARCAKFKCSFTKTVVMSGSDMVTEEEVLGNLGVDAFLRKPFDNNAVALFKKMLRVREFPIMSR